MDGDAALRDDGKVGIGRVVEEGGGEEVAGSGDEGRVSTLGLPSGDEAAGEDASRKGDFGGGVGVNVDVVEAVVVLEEELPERSEVEIRVGKEEECDFRFLDGGAAFGNGGAAEEGEVVELVGEGDLGLLLREDSWEEEEEQWA